MSNCTTATWTENENTQTDREAAIRFARLRQKVQVRRAAVQRANVRATQHSSHDGTDSRNATVARSRSGFAAFCEAWTENEQAIVRFVVQGSRRPTICRITSAINRLGNGWLYFGVLALVVALETERAFRPTLAAGLSLLVAFACYAWIKPRLARLRPCDADPAANSGIAPLDKYSFPSGHCMTASAVALPLLLSFPGAQLAIFAVGVVIAWSRLACGHHYLTDVVAGTILGAVVAAPICALVL